MKSIECERVEVIAHAVAPPALSSTRVGSVAFRVGPAHPQMGGLTGHKVVHLVDHQLVVPLLILGGSLTHTQEDIWPHTRKEITGIGLITWKTKLFFSILHLYRQQHRC